MRCSVPKMTSFAAPDRTCRRCRRQALEDFLRGINALLVFGPKTPIVLTMDRPWYRNWFRRSPLPDREATKVRADDGDADAQFSLGLKYATSEGESQDYSQAVQWYLKAADQSHALAQFNLAQMYAAGHGVPRDDGQALTWFQKAAQQGDAGAQHHLGMRHHRASVAGLPGDALESRIEAFKWFHLEAVQGYKGSATACERVTRDMTREDVADGNRRAAIFVAEKPIQPETK